MRYILSLLVCMFLAGCSQTQDQIVYDTANNPDNFPDQAVVLLDSIDSENLTTFEEISDRFGQLYTNHPVLLGDDTWRLVVSRLGLWFHRKGEQLISEGLSGYNGVAGYLALAALARPSDSIIQDNHAIFACWAEAAAKRETAALMDSLTLDSFVAPRLRFVRHFILADSLHQQFAREYLFPELFDGTSKSLTSDEATSLTRAETAMACYLGLIQHDPEDRIIGFSDPAVDLTYIDITPLEEHLYLAELYFYPRELIESDLTVALRLFTPDRDISAVSESLRFTPFDFQPEAPTSKWEEGKVALAFRTLRFVGEVTEGSVGLADKNVFPVRYLEPTEGEGRLHLLS